jgi:hypothetical protein
MGVRGGMVYNVPRKAEHDERRPPEVIRNCDCWPNPDDWPDGSPPLQLRSVEEEHGGSSEQKCDQKPSLKAFDCIVHALANLPLREN